MKKILLVIAALLLSCGLYAQNTEINRLLLHGPSTKGFIINNVDSLTFATVEGEVAADIELLSYDLETLTVAITRTASCEGFKIAFEPTVSIASMSDQHLAEYIDNNENEIYYQDFTGATMSGIEILPSTEYTIMTVGIDVYGVLCDVKKVGFTSPSAPILGNPEVATEIIELNQFGFTIKFTPNEDVSKYCVVAGAKGEMQSQYEMYAPTFGFSNIGEMIEMWGAPFTAEGSFEWEDLAPNTIYEVFIQAWDNNGVMAPYQVFEVTTEALGGEGTAEVTITPGEYKLADWWGEMLPSQFITYTPNDQVSAYRFAVYTAEQYDPDSEAIRQELCSEPPMPMVGWFYHEEVTTDYQINPNTECVAIAAAKNINGEWGPVTELRFTTPADMPSKSASKTIKERKLNTNNSKGTVPVKNQLRLISK